MTRILLWPAVLLLCGAAAATPADGSGPVGSDQVGEARELFLSQCGGCHLENGFGTRVLARRAPPGQALLEQREGLGGDFVKLVVRRGLGSMPQIRRAELSDADLDRIAAYLDAGR